ncbi:MAG: hypothetical protein WDN75_12780 [Bacteroidota bacterium]
MKKVIARFFILLFLLHFSGVYVFIGVRLVAIHSEIREKMKMLPDEDFEVIRMSAAEFEKSQVDTDELRWHDKMYDIGKIKITGDQLLLYVIHDSAEDSLLSFLNELIKRSEGDSSEEPSEILDFISLDYISDETVFHLHIDCLPDQNYFYSELLYSVTLPIESPPPRNLA